MWNFPMTIWISIIDVIYENKMIFGLFTLVNKNDPIAYQKIKKGPIEKNTVCRCVDLGFLLKLI